MGKTRDLFKKIRDTKGTFQAKMGTINPVPSTPERSEGLRACYWEGPSELPERRSSSSAEMFPWYL